MLTLSQAEIDALSSGAPRIGVFVRLDLVPVQRLWLGIGECRVGINALDVGEKTYYGLGQLLDVPPVQQLINGTAERVTFRVSGVSADMAAIAANESDSVKGVAITLGIGLFGASWQQLGVPKWLFRGRADFLSISQQPGDDGTMVRAVELSVGSLFTGRRRRGYAFFTDHDQQRRSPGDKFLERTSLYEQGVDKKWPTFPP